MNHHDDDLAGPLRDADEAGSRNDTDHDYARLAGGLSARAARVRRRRTVVTGAALVAITPAMAGAVFLGGRLLDSPGTVNPAGQPAHGVAPIALALPAGPAGPATKATATNDAVTSEETTDTSREAADPPNQDPDELLAPGYLENEGIQNQIAIPDPRPTGIAALDALGAPAYAERYQNITPAQNVTSSQELTGLEHHSAGSWHYAVGEGGAELVITLTAWDDSHVAFDNLTGGGTDLTSRWDFKDGSLRAPERLEWAGHEGDNDYLLSSQDSWYNDGSVAAAYVDVAMVRQGDYLVAVTLQTDHRRKDLPLVAEIADKTAANLAVLDPEHGTD